MKIGHILLLLSMLYTNTFAVKISMDTLFSILQQSNGMEHVWKKKLQIKHSRKIFSYPTVRCRNFFYKGMRSCV